MSGFKKDIFKASILAVLVASLTGATAFIVSQWVPQEEAEPIFILDAYDLKGGIGPNTVSGSYYCNENISIYAKVKDTAGNPIANTSVKLHIQGPHLNVTVKKEIKTNATGIATIDLTTIIAPYMAYQPDTVVGTWNVTAVLPVDDKEIIDTLTFEIKPIDLYTDRGGEGLDMPSQPYKPGDTVSLYAKVSNGTHPVANVPVVFVAYNLNTSLQEGGLVSSNVTNKLGIAVFTFRLAYVPEISVGTWKIKATARIYNEVFGDTLTFECTQPSE